LTATSNGAITIDGIALSANHRVLVKNQTTATQNGIYNVTTVGDASNPYVLTRARDARPMDPAISLASTLVVGDLISVDRGTVNQGGVYYVSSNGSSGTITTDTHDPGFKVISVSSQRTLYKTSASQAISSTSFASDAELVFTALEPSSQYRFEAMIFYWSHWSDGIYISPELTNSLAGSYLVEYTADFIENIYYVPVTAAHFLWDSGGVVGSLRPLNNVGKILGNVFTAQNNTPSAGKATITINDGDISWASNIWSSPTQHLTKNITGTGAATTSKTIESNLSNSFVTTATYGTLPALNDKIGINFPFIAVPGFGTTDGNIVNQAIRIRGRIFTGTGTPDFTIRYRLINDTSTVDSKILGGSQLTIEKVS
jgi:hypothetical protein